MDELFPKRRISKGRLCSTFFSMRCSSIYSFPMSCFHKSFLSSTLTFARPDFFAEIGLPCPPICRPSFLKFAERSVYSLVPSLLYKLCPPIADCAIHFMHLGACASDPPLPWRLSTRIMFHWIWHLLRYI
jgi:hypothetical protein